MAERRRSLPSWMAKKEETIQEKKSLKRKRKAARAAFYCMNEQELVEAAVSYLTNGLREDVPPLTHQQDEQNVVDTVKESEKSTVSHPTVNPVAAKEPLSDCTEDLDMTYVSETDLDITEVETLLYTKSLEHPASEGQQSGPFRHRGGLMNTDVEAGKTHEPLQTAADAAEDNDALRLVREIFFT